MKAFVFPGQGSQYRGMGRDFWEHYPAARLVFEEADEVLGFPLSRLCFEGPTEQLILTEFTQPAVLTVSVAIARVLEERGHLPDMVAGHSLGEYTGLVVAGALEFSDAVRIVHLRGRFMQDAVPVGTGGMTALLGLDVDEVLRICEEAAQGEVVAPANLNSPLQIVLAGHLGALERAGDLARQRGARRVIPLAVSAPFHCALMRSAQERLAPLLRETPFQDPRIPLVCNVDAAVIRYGEEALEALVRQVSSPVRWTDSVREMGFRGVTSFVEAGPGKVLTGLIRQIDPRAETFQLEKREQLEAYV